jgi:protein SCO1/2
MAFSASRLRNILPALLLVIIIPAIIILMAVFGKNKYKPLPYLGNPEGIAANGDTIRHSISPFTFTDQYGKPYGSEDLKGKIYVADFFFTSCPNICPVMTKNLKKVQEKVGKTKDFHIVSFTLDPKRDSAKRLAEYAAKYKITGDQWHFLTAPKEDIINIMGIKGYLVVKPIEGADPNQFQHSEVMVLVDKEGHIRGNYNGTDDKDIERLEEDIQYLDYSYGHNNNK